MKLLQSDFEEAERLLEQTKSEINTEKLQVAKAEAKTALVSKIGSLLGSGKLREVEQHNKKLCELVTDREQYIDELHEKIQRMEDRHSKQRSEVQQKHQSEVMDLKSAENGGYPPTQNGDIRSLFWLFSLMALQN